MPNKITKTRGIIYVAFGEEFDKLTAATAGYSRKFTDLPMCVLTNLKRRSSAWSKVSGVSFKLIALPAKENRRIKVSLIKYTPFDETLFMDSDAVIQKPGIESLFKHLKNFDIACQYFDILTDAACKSKLAKKTYGKLAKLLNEEFPIDLFGEAALLFKQSKNSYQFFDLWYKYWEMVGCGRDMPGFCFAVKHLYNYVKVFKENIKFCINKEDKNYYIQHQGFNGFKQKFNLPNYKDWNPKF